MSPNIGQRRTDLRKVERRDEKSGTTGWRLREGPKRLPDHRPEPSTIASTVNMGLFSGTRGRGSSDSNRQALHGRRYPEEM